jgi:cutinase
MRPTATRLAVATLVVGGLLTGAAAIPFSAAPLPVASAACPDAEVVFARGREEPPGVGLIGQSFITALRTKVPQLTVGAYGVNYPANTEVDVGANGTQRVLGPALNFSPAFAGKTIDLCAPNDPICTRSFQNLQWAAHLQPSYVDSGLVNKAANFVAGKL